MSEISLNPVAAAEWLPNMLKRNGHLKEGRAEAFYGRTFQTFFATFHRLNIVYSPDAAPQLPSRMLLKIPFSDNPSALEMGQKEVFGYRALREFMPGAPIPRCFESFINAETGHSRLLLEDLSETHFRADGKRPVSRRQWETCAEALADLHAFWWESESLGAATGGIGEVMDEAAVREAERLNRDSLPKFFAEMSGELSAEQQKMYTEVMEILPAFWRRRYTSRRRNTLIHGDAHSWNFLLPADPEAAGEQGRAFIIDLATLRVRPATNDLAYLMALKWRREQRAEMEMDLLRHYHSALTARGVKDYAWEDCLLDYRHSVLIHLFTPVVQCAGGYLSGEIWRANVARINAAYDDLNCAELK
jgi:thiamine kinase-like enzyme